MFSPFPNEIFLRLTWNLCSLLSDVASPALQIYPESNAMTTATCATEQLLSRDLSN